MIIGGFRICYQHKLYKNYINNNSARYKIIVSLPPFICILYDSRLQTVQKNDVLLYN